MAGIITRPRGYRIQEIVITNSGTHGIRSGFPEKRWRLQCRTHFGWNTLYTFHQETLALDALKEWEATLL